MTRVTHPVLLAPVAVALAALFVACGNGATGPAGNGGDEPGANQPPSVSIASPSSGDTVPEGQDVLFEGSASDPEDGDLTGEALVWESDVDGELGTGEQIVRSDLSTDEHTITLTATDSDGLTESAEVRLTVEPRVQKLVVSDSTSRGTTPSISGNRIVWVEDRNGRTDLFLYNVTTQTETRITPEEADVFAFDQPAISGDRIVWTDNRHGHADIFLYDLSTGTETRITDDPNHQRDPDISGDRIVFLDNRVNPQGDIVLYDISIDNLFQITDDELWKEPPAISGDQIVWGEITVGTPSDPQERNIVVFNLSTAIETVVRVAFTDLPMFPDISGDRIAWVEDLGVSNDIFFHDMSTKTTTEIASNVEAESESAVGISGERIVFPDFEQLFVYDVTTETATRIPNDLDQMDLQASPDISAAGVVSVELVGGPSSDYRRLVFFALSEEAE